MRFIACIVNVEYRVEGGGYVSVQNHVLPSVERRVVGEEPCPVLVFMPPFLEAMIGDKVDHGAVMDLVLFQFIKTAGVSEDESSTLLLKPCRYKKR